MTRGFAADWREEKTLLFCLPWRACGEEPRGGNLSGGARVYMT